MHLMFLIYDSYRKRPSPSHPVPRESSFIKPMHQAAGLSTSSSSFFFFFIVILIWWWWCGFSCCCYCCLLNGVSCCFVLFVCFMFCLFVFVLALFCLFVCLLFRFCCCFFTHLRDSGRRWVCITAHDGTLQWFEGDETDVILIGRVWCAVLCRCIHLQGRVRPYSADLK